MQFPELTGKRIKLIHLSKKYLDDMYEYSRNPLMYRYFEFPVQKTKKETSVYLKKLIKRSNVGTAHYWFISLRNSGKVIGSIGAHDIDWRKKNGEISYGLSPYHWGQGYFHETLMLLLQFMFRKLSFHRICAITRYDNLPSIKSLKRCGFKKEGRLRDFYLSHNGKRYDAVILGLLRHEYHPQKARKQG